MSVIGTMCDFWKSRPGTRVTIAEPGLKPSLRFHSSGSMRTPDVLAGMPARGRSRRRLVGVDASFWVNALLGQGYMQADGSRGSQVEAAAAGVAPSASSPMTASRVTLIRTSPYTHPRQL